MGLLAEIQNDALSDITPVATLLRKVMVLASNIESGMLEDWVRHELNGYLQDADVPKYRTMGINFKASGADFTATYTNMPIAQMVVENTAQNDEISTFRCRQAIGTINADDLKNGIHVYRLNFDNFLPLMQRQMNDGIYLHSFWGEVSASMVFGILDAVRSRVLDFVLALKKQYPQAGEVDGLMTKTPEVERALTQIYNTTIHGDNAGPVGNNTGASMTITVNQGNKHQLRQELSKHGVDETDIIELEAALLEEPQIESNKRFGPKVAGWMGKMAGKAATGAWAVGLSAGSALLQAALLGYYGFGN